MKQEKYTDIFPSRLRKLIDDRGTTITALSKELKISRQAVSQYADGTGQPNVEKLRSIACYFGVSTDYLVGLSDYEKQSTGKLTASDMGIMDEAAQQLAEDKKTRSGISGVVLSILAKSSQFYDFSSALVDYIHAVNHAQKFSNNVSSIFNERKNVRMKQFLLTEALFDVLNESIPLPDFSEKENLARERERKNNAIHPQDDK